MDQVLNPLRRRFRDKWKKDSAEGRRIAEVWEIRARRADHTPWYGEDQVEVELTFVIAPDALQVFSEDEADQPTTAEINTWAQANDDIAKLAGKLESIGNPTDRSYLWQRLVLAWIAKCGTDHRVAITGATARARLHTPWREPGWNLGWTSTTSQVLSGEFMDAESSSIPIQ